MRVVGVDIGGTFTDLMLYDTDVGVGARPQGAVDRRPTPERAMVGGLDELCDDGRARAVGRRPASSTGRRSRRTPCSSTTARVAGMITIARLPRHRPHRAPPAAAALLGDAGHPVAGAPVRAAPPSQGGERADRAADRRGARAARRGRGARRGARAARRGRRGGRGLLPLLVPQPGARAARGGDRARGDARTRSSRRASTSSRSSASSSASRRRRSARSSARRPAATSTASRPGSPSRASTASCT